MEMRSQLSRVRGLGASKGAVHHFTAQRLSAIALVPLILWFVVAAVDLVGADHATFKAWVGTHYNPVLLGLLIVTGFYHGLLGLQVIVEDYIHGEVAKTATLIAIKFATVLLGASALFAIFRLTFGG